MIREVRGQVALFLVLTMAPFTVMSPLIGPLLDRFRHGRRWAIGTTVATRAFLCWVLAEAFVIYVVGTVLAIRLPALVDSSQGEQDRGRAAEAPVAGPWAAPWAVPRNSTRGGLLGGFRHRVDALPWRVLFALWCTSGTRLLAGFLTFFLAFLIRDHPISDLSSTLVLGLVVVAAGVGNTFGSVVGTLVKGRSPETLAATILLLATVTAVTTAVFYSAWTLVTLGLMAGLSSQLAKLGLNALVQRDVGEMVRTSVFACSETLLQIA
jgi:MFS family permease